MVFLRYSLSLLLICGLLPTSVVCEIRDFRVVLEPDSTVVHYSEGYLKAPGYIDLSNLRFSTTGAAYPDDFDPSIADDATYPDEADDVLAELDDDGEGREGDDDGEGGGGEGDDATADDDENGGGGRRRLMDTGITQIDIAVMHLPGYCANTRSGCDWTDFGIGATSPEGDVRWCCSADAVELGLCEGGPKYGKLIVNSTKFSGSGSHRLVEIDPTGDVVDQKLKYGEFEEVDNNGRYVVIFANCNDEGREVLVEGATVWKSKHGYLPGELFEFMYFYAFVTLVYFVLMGAYGLSMQKYSESNIPLEKWILGTIIMGLLETFFRTGAFFVWNEDGTQLMIAVYIGVFMGVLKCGISRCLIVMVSLGWGVVRDSLGATLPKIVALGIFYVAVSSVNEFMTVIAVEDMQTLSVEEEDELFDVVEILSFLVFVVDVIFVLWILDALNSTMEYLESMNQTRKLMRYLRFRCVFLFAILFSVVWVVFSLVDTYDEDGILEEQHEWVVLAAKELNYLFLLVGIAVLWWPNETAKEYAYVMELPAIGEGDDEDHELEMTGNVPSAADDDDDDKKGNGGSFEDEFDEGFK